MKMLIEYNSMNSGGQFWLEDKDWINLEKAGWKVKWNNYDFVYDNGNHRIDDDGYPVMKKTSETPDRWLGCIAQYAFKIASSPSEAMKDFEKITGQDITDEGCNCCGAPHNFSWEGGYASGEDCIPYLFDKPKKTLREFYEDSKGLDE